MNTEKIKEILCILIAFFIPILVFSLLVHIWNLNLQIPYWEAQGDGYGPLTIIRNFVDGHFIYWFPRLNVPDGTYMTASVQDGMIHLIGMFCLAQITKSVGLTYNLYYIIGFGLTSLCTYVVARRLKISCIVSITIGILYTFIPYHFMRSMHMNLVAYYYIPFVAFTFICIIQNRKLDLIAMTGMVFVTFGSLYYTAFTFILIVFTMVIMPKHRRNIKSFAIYFTILSGSIVILYTMPKIATYVKNYQEQLRAESQDDNKAENNFTDDENTLTLENVGATRSVAEFNDYALKENTLFLPTLYHRISFWNEKTKDFYEKTNIHFDAYMTSVGVFILIGLLYSIVSLFTKQSNEIATLCGRYNIFLVLCSMTGGLNLFIAQYFSTAIRCFNRMIVFIAFFSVIALGVGIQQVIQYIEKRNGKWYKKLTPVILMAVMILGILDQTPGYLSTHIGIQEITPHNLSQTYEGYADAYYQNECFWNYVEEGIQEESIIYTFKGDISASIEKAFVFTKKLNVCQKQLNTDLIISEIDCGKFLEKVQKQKVKSVILLKENFTNEGDYEKQKSILDKNSSFEKYVDEALGAAYKVL